MGRINSADFYQGVKARVITLMDMQNDYDFEMANYITKSLYKNALISKKEMDHILKLNQEKFTPYYKELMD